MTRVSFPELEKQVLDFWKKNEIFKKSLSKPAPQGNFVFYEGPPTANGKPGLHHVLARAFKDVIPRYKTMQGYHVERKAGWDTHGLPVELQVEKQLNISGKPDIESLKKDLKQSIEYFNTECKKSVWEYKEEWERMTERMGYWIDLDKPYVTYDNAYIESLWWIIKQIDEKGFLYKGYKVVPHCPRCGTALSSHEVAQGYKEVEENSVFMKFKVQTVNDRLQAGDYILSWTTTPWTLPGNVALAVGDDFVYVKIKYKNDKSGAEENLILAKALLNKIDGTYEIIDEFKGKEIVGISYEPLFPGAIPESVANFSNAFKVYPADFVTTEDGTGIVHTAVMYGEDDYQLGEQVGLPKHHTVTTDGEFDFSESTNDILQKLHGQFVKESATENFIINYLKDNGLLYKEQPYKHDYPFCWRCDTPLLYYAKDSWFIRMSALREELKKNNEKINWIPTHIKDGRFGEWLEGAKDWALSRERYWGTPLPVWICGDCKKYEVIGSIKELIDRSYNEVPENPELHRPFIDDLHFKCKECESGIMTRDSSVLDCWFDSGSMPFAQYHYPFENKDLIDKGEQYPADYICEAIDQTRGWFYTLLAVATLLDKGVPYKNVICLGHINDKFGKKMSKSKGNVINPWEVMEKYGADSLRFHLYTVNQPGEAKNFDPKQVEDVLKKNWLILWNVLSFYQMYVGKIDTKKVSAAEANHVLDRWLRAVTNSLAADVAKFLDKYDVNNAGRVIMQYINDLSTWYVRRSRDRFKAGGDEQLEAVKALGQALWQLAKILAPFTPFLAEKLYQELKKDCPVADKQLKESVHLEDWPEIFTLAPEDKTLLNQMASLRSVVEKALALRADAGIKIRQPLPSLSITQDLPSELLDILRQELNVKEVLVSDKFELDTNITDDLRMEGLVREMTRLINSLRKQAGLTINDQVVLVIETQSEMINKVIDNYADELKKATLANNIEREPVSGEHIKELKIAGEKLSISIKKV